MLVIEAIRAKGKGEGWRDSGDIGGEKYALLKDVVHFMNETQS